MATAHMLTLASGLTVPLIQYNSTVDGEGFFISYNDHDIDLYGDVTTAFVIGQMEGFLTLNGDHREGYAALIPLGFDACLAYFMDNIEQANKHSEHHWLQGRVVKLPI
jgi:hypothetical protein